MQTLTGHSYLGGPDGPFPGDIFDAINPATREILAPAFREATPEQVDLAVSRAAGAFDPFRHLSPDRRALFLEAIIEETLALGDAFLERCSAETGHPLARCLQERDRVVKHTRQFAELLREGSWVDARIDRGDPERKPIPKPDVRSLLQAIGPVAVFGASNFPIAISVLGVDTISALAAGCPVIVKGHPAHPGTCEMAAAALLRAAEQTGMPEGVFALLQGSKHEIGSQLVRHPALAAVAFTGSLAGGRALADLAAARPVPIPLYAEMGSLNPVFLLPEALATRGPQIAAGFVQALTIGVGQFCTNPGLVVGLDSPAWHSFTAEAQDKAASVAPATMLHSGIHQAYTVGVSHRQEHPHLQALGKPSTTPDPARHEAAAYLFTTTRQGLIEDPSLLDELFGPCATLVRCENAADLVAIAEQLEGSLSATVHGTEADMTNHAELLSVLSRKAGRLICNGYPVGLEICDSIHHGGPYPATTHSHFTSIGTRAIHRFVRPVCYQDWPMSLLPRELQEGNPCGVMRMVDGVRGR
jgi:2,5-dioxopentanoate dehydrogenase